MATIKEYYETDAKVLTMHFPKAEYIDGILMKVAMDHEANAKYWYFYIPEVQNVFDLVENILKCSDTENCVLSPEEGNSDCSLGFADYSEKMHSNTFVFTKRVFFYVNAALDVNSRNQIKNLGSGKYHIIVRDREYARCKSAYKKPLAFISHDSRDKDAIVRPLALKLIQLFCPVWYDEYSLKVGDNLRESIEKGLKEARKCILVLSPNFLSNNGWTKAEYDSIFTREILERRNVILPIWHNVNAKDIYEYSPKLANILGLQSSIGIDKLAISLASVIKQT